MEDDPKQKQRNVSCNERRLKKDEYNTSRHFKSKNINKNFRLESWSDVKYSGKNETSARTKKVQSIKR